MKPTIESIPLVAEQKQPEGDAGDNNDPVIQDISFNTSLSRYEILSIKKKNRTKSLRRLQKLRKLSTSAGSNSSNAFVVDASKGSINLMIQQLKAYIFEIYLYKSNEEDANFGNDSQKLLQEINKQKIPDSRVQFLFDFEAFFNHICRDIYLKITYDAQF